MYFGNAGAYFLNVQSVETINILIDRISNISEK